MSSASLECETQHAIHRARRPLPFRHFGVELPLALARDRVEPRPPIVVRDAPFGPDPAATLHALQRGIEGTLVDVENVARDLTEPDGESPSVHWLDGQELEREHLEGALEHLGSA